MSTRSIPGPGGAGIRLAVVGPSTLKGKELTEILPDSSLAAAEVRLLDAEETLGNLEAVGEEMTFVQSVAADNVEGADVVFFASDAAFTKKSLPIVQRAGSAVVDLSYGLEGDKGTSVRSTWVDRELGAGVPMDLQPGPVVVAHPAATVLAILMLRIERLMKPRAAVVTVFEPASERGRKGLDELHQQTVNLLSFQNLPKDVFDTQVAFNVVPRFGAGAQPTLESTEKKIVDHFRSLVREHATVPSLALVQASIFHGHAFSLYIETDKPVAVTEYVKGLAGEHVEIVGEEEEAPSTVAAAGQESIMVSIKRDGQHENGVWIWAASDNLRIMALNAIGVAEQLVASRPRGQVQ